MVILAFIFSSELTELEGRIYLMNCPYPSFSAFPYNVTINNVNVEYELNYTGFENDLFIFTCSVAENGTFGVSIASFESTEGFFSLFDNAFAWIGYVYSSITVFFGKVVSFFIVIWTLFDAPAEVTGFSFFTYINILLSAFVGLGTFMVMRGN